jgi:hypothetical protein
MIAHKRSDLTGSVMGRFESQDPSLSYSGSANLVWRGNDDKPQHDDIFLMRILGSR